MPDQPVPDDRQMQAALAKLKAYNDYKAKQTQTGGKPPIEPALTTIETWANDASDSGQQAADQKKAEADKKGAEAQRLQQQVEADQQEAKLEESARAKMDMPGMKDNMKKTLDDYLQAIQRMVDQGQPGAKGKLSQVKMENIEAKKFIDGDFEKMVNESAVKMAQKRQRNKLIADKAQADADQAQKSSQQAAADPAGAQRQDVQDAADEVATWADESIAQFTPFGSKAKPVIAELTQVSAWAKTLKTQAAGPGAAGAKSGAKAGVAKARETAQHVAAFESSLESEGNDNLDMFQRWTDHNNALAKQWQGSSSAPHREWAEAWMKTQQ